MPRKIGSQAAHDRWKDGLDIATKLVAIAGIPLFIYQQYASAIDKKKDRTFEYVKEYRSSDMENLRYRLSAVWDDLKDKIAIINSQGGLASADRDDLVRLVVGKQAEDAKAVYAINDFFDTLLACINADHCDRVAGEAYFADYAKQFYCLYGTVIRDRRTQLAMKTYGASLEAFVNSKGGC
jgi:hypothetical protein